MSAAPIPIRRTKQSAFQKAVDEALQYYREVTAPGPFGPHDGRAHKLNPQAWLSKALDNARTDEAALRKLEKVLEGAELPTVTAFLGICYERFTSTGPESPSEPPKSNLGALWGGGSEHRQMQMVALLVECATIGSNPLQLVALASLRATRERPDAFGQIDDLDAHRRKLDEQERHLQELYQRVAESWTHEDVSFELVDARRGLGRLVVRIRPEVSVHPLETFGQRLVEAMARA